MAATVFVARETAADEPRVAASAETVKRMVSLGLDVIVEAGAGEGSRIPDRDFEAAGATIGTAEDAGRADVVLKVRRPGAAEIRGYKPGAIVIAIMDPYGNEAAIAAMAKAGLTAFAMELMPRITRAQSMDGLSSQANLAGYQAVIDAAHEFDRAMPMMMTAAGTVPAAKVFVMGAGVAGLQAIATAKRLGAAVSATDVRPAAKEQVASLGGKFIAVEDEEFKAAETAGGYAKEMSKDYQAKQAALVADHIAKQDIVITTALIPGRPAPRLVSRDMLRSMKSGSVAVDLAVERGGNIEGSVAGEVADVEGVRVIGYLNVPGRIATSASQLYAKNLFTFLETLVDKEAKTIRVDTADELVKATALTHEGAAVHPAFREAAEAAMNAPEPAARETEAEPSGSAEEVAGAAKGTEPGLDVAPKPKRAPRRGNGDNGDAKAAPRRRAASTAAATKKGDS
ncbi:MAG: Re/Si-specific NAD(P)(+) transhydrogenase subunit alpha [Pararhizobium sp.]